MVNGLRILDRKLVRDLWHLRGPAVAIAVIAMCGIASFVALRSMQFHLKSSQARYYQVSRFADVFASVKRAPRALVRQLAAIPGVSTVEVRSADDIVLDVPGRSQPANGRLVGVPIDRTLGLNLVSIRSGRPLSANSRDEVLISEGFANANALAPGDSLGAIIGGHWRRLRIAGIAVSPEFVYQLSPGSILPDERGYGVVWMDERAVAAAVGRTDAWNEVSLSLTPGAQEADVIARVDRVLAPYGTLGAYGRELHLSHRFLSDEIEQNRTFAAIIPAIFLVVAAFLVHLVLSRLVASQREQIGMMKAFGFGQPALARHFGLLAMGPVVPGAIAGSALGIWVAGKLAVMYADYFRIPDAPFVPRASVIVLAVTMSAAAAALGAYSALRAVWRLRPAESMRPEAPPRFRHSRFERFGFMRALSPVSRMVYRTIARRPLRAGASILGLALGVAVIIVGRYSYDAIAVMRRIQFMDAQREDIAVTFASPRNDDALRELAALPGVLRVEPTISTPVQLQRDQHTRKVSLVGVPEGAVLRHVVDGSGRAAAMPEAGVMLSAALADLLGVKRGDRLRLQVLIGERRTTDVLVSATLNDIIGTTAYVSLGEYARLTGSADADGAVLAVDPRSQDSVYARLKLMPGVRGVAARDAMLRSFDESVAKGFTITLVTLIIFAAALAAGVTYNIARIALAERARDLASLRVLGFTRGEVARMLFGEQGVLATIAVPAGFILGAILCWWMATALTSDLFRLPFVIRFRTFVFAAAVLVLSAVLSGALVRRRLDRLDLVSVLKTRE